jgi:Bifunctional DNA primase/polymerase, N-terminal
MSATEVFALRLELVSRGYTPVPLFGKNPALKNWQQLQNVSREQLDMWARSWPDSRNTGILCKDTPTLDLDILIADAVRAIVDYVHEHFDERGFVDVRTGLAPKAAIPFRTIEPFAKILVAVIPPNGDPAKPEKVEFLGAGQQFVAYGIHPDTRAPYVWSWSEPLQHEQQELPYIREAEARALVEHIVDAILVGQFGYTRAKGRPGKRRTGNGADETGSGGAEDWAALVANIQRGQDLHDSLCALAAKVVASGMQAGAAVNYLRGLMDAATCPHDERWKERRAEIPRLVDSAVEKYAKPLDQRTRDVEGGREIHQGRRSAAARASGDGADDGGSEGSRMSVTVQPPLRIKRCGFRTPLDSRNATCLGTVVTAASSISITSAFR